MEYQFIHYPKCSTCKKAKKWLQEHNINFIERDIVEDCPSEEELEKWILASGKTMNSFFNTSGLVYKSLNLKEKLPTLNDKDKIKLLASNGMLIKRPLLIGENLVINGFRKNEWEEKVTGK